MKSLKAYIMVCAISLLCPSATYGQGEEILLEQALQNYFTSYALPHFKPKLKIALDTYSRDDENKTLDVYGNEGFSSQTFTPEIVEKIYTDLRQAIPAAYKDYELRIYAFDKEINEFVPSIYRQQKDPTRLWNKLDYREKPWTNNISSPHKATKGLQGNHLTIWASHGRYYNFDKMEWSWQRPQLFCTTEDMFTQSIVIPFLIPMLENSGAIVYTPRERDWQSNEVIVDNDPCQTGQYTETIGREKWEDAPGYGFARIQDQYPTNHNPFKDGTVRMTKASPNATPETSCQWTPQITEEGDYAVYVSYLTLPESIDDARYTIIHNGIPTQVEVNQQMGGSTWVYLGTYHFGKGQSERNCVTLTNHSNRNGIVTADAVRLGGGMGNIVRGDSIDGFTSSGLPRYLEGARYYAQWSGMPESAYDTKDGYNDYADDINARSRSLDYLGGGSIYIPAETGCKVPFELSLAVHSDAGATRDGSVIGTLAVHTQENDSLETTFHSGVSRMASLDFAGQLQNTLCEDLTQALGKPWTRRELYNRNYSETRLPEVPSAIIETLSHQNFTDMKYGHDPNFKFLIARSIYKGILRHIAHQHQREYVMQPLPPDYFSAILQPDGQVLLSWMPTKDELNPEAETDGYIVYTRRDGEDFDNGILVNGATAVKISIEPDVIYSFKVCAVNAGGKSFPTETLSVMKASQAQNEIIIVNGFTRLSGPAVVNTATTAGFDMEKDHGVAYIHTPEYCGTQQNFQRQGTGKEGPKGLGYSGDELQGIMIAGNTFDYPYIHGKSIQKCKNHSFSSCSMKALTGGTLTLDKYAIVDLILGLQKNCGESSIVKYKTFPPSLQEIIKNYTAQGGSILVSGSYIASDMKTQKEREFTSTVLHYAPATAIATTDGTVKGNGMEFSFVNNLGSRQYAVSHPDILAARGKAFPFLTYSNGNCAGIAYQHAKQTMMILGFPFESITTAEDRDKLMNTFLYMQTQ